MPFDFLRRKKPTPQPTKAARGADRAVSRPTGPSIAFEGMTEEWRLVGRMYIDVRLSDALNRREALPISDVSWAPVDGSSGFSPVPGLKSVDPYDLIVVQAGEGSKPARSEADEAAAKVHKTPYDLILEAPPLRIVGKVFLTPGTEPRQLMDRSADMFLPVVGGVAYLGDRAVTDPKVEAILVNRFYLRGVEENRPTRPAPPDVSWPAEPKLRPTPKPAEQKNAPAPKPAEQKSVPPPKPAEPKAPPEQKAQPEQKAPEQRATPEQKRATDDEKPAGPVKRPPRTPTHPTQHGWPKER